MKRITEPFGKAGLIVAALALVFALVGGAYAASNDGNGSSQASASAKKKSKRAAKRRAAKRRQAGLNRKQRRQVIALAKRFAGQGPQGPVGPAGPQGEKGDDGSDGSDGSDGQDGARGATGAQGPKGDPGPQGDPGPEGSPWTVGGTLPAGETLTGTWSFSLPGAEGIREAKIPLSFSIPLEERIASSDNRVYVKTARTECEANEEEEAECLNELETKCPAVALGSEQQEPEDAAVENPSAAPGFLCVYEGSLVPAADLIVIEGLSTAGGVLTFGYLSGSGGSGKGSWAVTAPTS